MNWIPKAIAILGVATALSVVSPTIHAQNSQTQETQPQPSREQRGTQPNRQSSEKPDLDLLAKTLVNFLSSDRYQTESKLQVSGTAPGTTFTSYAQLKTIAQSPNKFRAEIAFTQPDKGSGPSYLVVSNGKQVWIYRPDLKQYATTSYEDFKKSDDLFLIGLSSMMFLEVPPDFREMISQSSASGNTLGGILEQMGLSSKSPLKVSRRNLQGQDYYAYEYTEPKEGFTLSALVEPTTARVTQLEITGKSEGMDILLREEILNRVGNPAIAADTFTFVPPTGSKKVESLRIEPF